MVAEAAADRMEKEGVEFGENLGGQRREEKDH